MYDSLRRREAGNGPPTPVPARCPPASTRGRTGTSCADTSASPPSPPGGRGGAGAPSSPPACSAGWPIRVISWSRPNTSPWRGGKAPGPNGLRLEDLDRAERWELTRALGRAIEGGTYRPGPHREVEIPKGPGRGSRTLQIQDVEDRVVQRAIIQIVQPLLDPTFADTSFSYRPGRGCEHALAAAEGIVERAEYLTWVLEDVRDAFEQVPLGRLIDVLRGRLPGAHLMDLVRAVIGNDARRGLRQGGSLSPLLLKPTSTTTSTGPGRDDGPRRP